MDSYIFELAEVEDIDSHEKRYKKDRSSVVSIAKLFKIRQSEADEALVVFERNDLDE